MKNAGSTIQIEVDSLRIGMFIHLDVGWMSHPFALSSFRLASAEQIAVIRSLGLRHVRWSPEQSALLQAQDDAARAIGTAAASAGVDAAVAESPELGARRAQRAAASAERASLALCEQQFSEATRECRRLNELVSAQPRVAGEHALALVQTFADKMLGERSLCIRLLTEAAGERAAVHALNVTLIALLMGRRFGLGPAEMQDLGVGALLHDVGKLELPPRVRHCEDHFGAADTKLYEEHVTRGVAQALKMGLSPGATLVIAQHHEHADGTGFPLKLSSERMTTASRIVALVNRYDTLCNPVMPAKALTPHEALSLLFAQGKHKIDTAILGSFIKMMGVYPPGSVVQLTDDRFAMVASVNASRPLKPRVVVHNPQAPHEDATLIDLEHTPKLGIRRSVRPQALPRDAFDCLSPRQRIACFFEPDPEDVLA